MDFLFGFLLAAAVAGWFWFTVQTVRLTRARENADWNESRRASEEEYSKILEVDLKNVVERRNELERKLEATLRGRMSALLARIGSQASKWAADISAALRPF